MFSETFLWKVLKLRGELYVDIKFRSKINAVNFWLEP